MRQFQAWYPDPPLVLLISNNEHAKLTAGDAEQSRRYLDRFGSGKSDDFKRQVIGEGWIERYGAMLSALREGLVSESWRKNSKCVGYEAFPPVHFGRWSGWKEYSLVSPGRLDPFPLCWDGGSPSYYLHNWMALTDYTVWSPQIESMNWVFMLHEVYRHALSSGSNSRRGMAISRARATISASFTSARGSASVPRATRDLCNTACG